MENEEIRRALDRHWAAAAAGDIEVEHEIYHDDVLVEYPQSGERIRGRHNIQALRGHHPIIPFSRCGRRRCLVEAECTVSGGYAKIPM